MKKAIIFVVLMMVMVSLSSPIAVVSAAGGTSPYITPEPTSYNLDIVGIFGAIVYGIGIILAGYGRVLHSFASRQLG